MMDTHGSARRTWCGMWARLERLEPRRMLAAAVEVNPPLHGAFGEYFDDAALTVRVMDRHDAQVDFDWGEAAPALAMGDEGFGARWRSMLVAPVEGEYRFAVETDGGVRLNVRGFRLVDQWSGGPAGLDTFEGDRPLFLRAGQAVDLKLEYTHATGHARVRLLWQPPGAGVFEPIPTQALRGVHSPDVEISNPIAATGADPFVTRWGDGYAYVRSVGGGIRVATATSLQEVFTAPSLEVFNPPNGRAWSHNLWAPELHHMDGKWWIYFAADDGDNANHRMYVLESQGDDPRGPYSFRGKISPTTDRWAIDGTVVEISGTRYFVWSGWQGFTDGSQELYIAEMSSPTTLTGDRVRIAAPTYNWERHGLAINEGPQVFQPEGPEGPTHLVYSASGFWTQQYALGLLSFTGGDPMNPSSWQKTPTPVFSASGQVKGVGHASFVPSPDGREWWTAYHAHRNPDGFDGVREVRLQPFAVDATGRPNFGAPVQGDLAMNQPGGTPWFYKPFGPTLAPVPAPAVKPLPGPVRPLEPVVKFAGREGVLMLLQRPDKAGDKVTLGEIDEDPPILLADPRR